MPVVNLVEHGRQLPTQTPVDPDAEDAGDGIRGEAKEAHFTGALEDLVDREVASKDEIPAVFNLIQGVVASQMHRGAILA
jgi:hypothetical protein